MITWLLDVDGVLNGGGRCGWLAPPRTSRVFANGCAWRMRWAPALIEHIRRIHASGTVRILWASTWIEDDNTRLIEACMGLPQLEHAFVRLPHETHDEAKLRAALEQVALENPLIWTDDVAIPMSGPDREQLEAAGALLISPNPRRGLRPDHLAMIDTFIANHSPRKV